tara:strand:- start:1098 stop:1199 length:102 start_codon:yes stop_codon:yes gene_type:complete
MINFLKGALELLVFMLTLGSVYVFMEVLGMFIS